MKKILAVPIFILSLCFFSLARADQITAIQVTPASPQQGSPVTVKLLGTGNCNNLDLSWGDGTLDLKYNPNFNLPFTNPPQTQHTYQNPGTYTIKVVDVKGCQGKNKQTKITVAFTAPATGATGGATAAGGGIINLCAKVDCAALFGPHIDHFVFGSNFTPGGNVGVVGSGFGIGLGQLHMVGYGPLIPFKLTDTVVQVVAWNNTSISATIPANITGVVDQPVAFYVLTANNVKSNYSFTVQFTATREVKLLDFAGPAAAKLLSCGTDSNQDQCNDWIDPADGTSVTWSVSGVTFLGYHSNCWACIGDDGGSDVYLINVPNGWVLDHFDFNLYYEAGAHVATAFPQGATSWQPTIDWTVTPNDDLLYQGYVYIVGPKGVPIN
jgi:hypothetical protein